jgi:hypothetical protein
MVVWSKTVSVGFGSFVTRISPWGFFKWFTPWDFFKWFTPLKFFYLVHSKTFLNPGFISSSFLLGHSKFFYRVFSLVCLHSFLYGYEHSFLYGLLHSWLYGFFKSGQLHTYFYNFDCWILMTLLSV